MCDFCSVEVVGCPELCQLVVVVGLWELVELVAPVSSPVEHFPMTYRELLSAVLVSVVELVVLELVAGLSVEWELVPHCRRRMKRSQRTRMRKTRMNGRWLQVLVWSLPRVLQRSVVSSFGVLVVVVLSQGR